MENSVYKVDSKMKPPVILAMSAGMVLIVFSMVRSHNFLFFIVLTPFLYLGLEILARKIIVDSNGVTIQKFLRSSRLNWVDIQNVDAVRSGSKTFLILQTSSVRPVLITNSIASFQELANTIVQRIPGDKVSESAREMSQSSPRKLWPLIQAWLVCVIFWIILVGKLLE
ncbi:MAG: hypothetical protein M0T73_01225 [Deltaproteobacteria bacterium]|nr:hypothetical protein [Deltaproteobacteria bacterium]